MDFFSLLREHARTRTETIAVSSPRRSMTYRKLWSRIERATARLQQEWGVGKGDVVAYCGHAHPDALVLYFALARSGGRLLPLPAEMAASELAFFTQEFRLRLLVKDDELLPAAEESFLSAKPLSALIATRCPHEPAELIEDPYRPVLLWRTVAMPAHTAAYSLAQLWEAGADAAPISEARLETLFEPTVLSRTVLPVLQSGGRLVLP